MSLEDAMRPKVIDTYEIESYLSLMEKPKNAIIITSRSFEESSAIRKKLDDPELHVYFAPYTIKDYTPEKAWEHLQNIIEMLNKIGYEHRCHFG